MKFSFSSIQIRWILTNSNNDTNGGTEIFLGLTKRDANLAGFNLVEAQLTRANLEKATLENADLSQTNLMKAVLSSANLQAAKLIKAQHCRDAIYRVSTVGLN